MAKYAHLKVDLTCRNCASVIADEAWFQWGYARSSLQVHDVPDLYRLGDQIQWKKCRDGSVLSWTYFTNEANHGDPKVEDIVVRDTSPMFARSSLCKRCGAEIDGVDVEIRHGAISRAWIYPAGEFDEAVSLYTLEGNTIVPMPEWENHAMSFTADC